MQSDNEGPAPASAHTRPLVDGSRVGRLLERLAAQGLAEGEPAAIVLEEIVALYATRPGTATLLDSGGRVRASSEPAEVGARLDLDVAGLLASRPPGAQAPSRCWPRTRLRAEVAPPCPGRGG
jgi:hypothetical protein